MWLRAQTANPKLKQNALTIEIDGRQAFFCVIYDTFRGHISKLLSLMRGLRASIPLRFR